MNKKNAIKTNSVLDSIQIFLNVLIGIFFVPYYLTFFTPELYGFWISSSAIIVLLDIFDFGINTIFIERLSKLYNAQVNKEFYEYFSNGCFVYLIISLIIFIGGSFTSLIIPFVFKLGEFENIIVNCFRISVLTTVMKLINSMFRGYSHSVLRPKKYGLNQLYGTVAGIFVILLFLNLGFNLYSLAFGLLFQQIITLVFNFHTISNDEFVLFPKKNH